MCGACAPLRLGSVSVPAVVAEERYDPETASWHSVPVARSQSESLRCGFRRVFKRLYIYRKPTESHYTSITMGVQVPLGLIEAMLRPRFAPALACMAGKLYVCGGADDGGNLGSVECFEPATGWREVAPMHAPRVRGAAAAVWD